VSTTVAPAAVIVLAAGEGKRMKSATPKVLHQIAGRSLVAHVLTAAGGLQATRTIVVVGHGREQVGEHLAEHFPDVETVVQPEQNGTGHAVRLALAALGPDLSGTVVILAGDTPLIASSTLQSLLARHQEHAAAATVLTAVLADASGYGRVLRGADGLVTGIVEHRDASSEQLAITEINSGMYAFEATDLRSALERLGTDNDQGEEYLTDAIATLRADDHRVAAEPVAVADEVLGVNDRVQLAHVAGLYRDRLLQRWMREGVTVIDPSSVWIDADVTLAPDVLIQPDVQLLGATDVASGASVGPRCTLTDTEVGEGASVIDTFAMLARIGAGASVGPFTYLRPGADIGPGAKAGAYVEIKNSVVGAGAKVPHLSYVGDADIGEGANIGAATVFVNYDGIAKHRTTVGEHARVGSDTMLVAPVVIGPGAYTAAGSVITEDVPPGAIGVGRARQRTIPGWVQRKRAGTKSAEAAARAAESSDNAESSDKQEDRKAGG
jgi:bifunctional UDP-N-acetylglucosamine pyrophosphorylase/glucosamine-1-phosphate N-acetyltransferase